MSLYASDVRALGAVNSILMSREVGAAQRGVRPNQTDAALALDARPGNVDAQFLRGVLKTHFDFVHLLHFPVSSTGAIWGRRPELLYRGDRLQMRPRVSGSGRG